MQGEEAGPGPGSEPDAEIEFEGGGPAAGGSAGRPADTRLEQGVSLTGTRQKRHWRESTITDDDLSDRGGVFFAAVEMTRMPMILTDPRRPDNPIAFANKAFLDLTGYEEAEVLGRNCRFLQGPATDRDAVRQMREAIAGHQPISLEILNYKRDGTPFWNAIFVGPVFNPQGELLYFFASQLDVTRRRSTEDSHRQAQKMEAVGQLTAGLAHDFNNLLQVITGSNELLLREVEAPSARRRLEMAQQAAQRGAKLTRQLLAFARKTRLEPKPLHLSQLVSGISELLASTAGSTVELVLSLRQRLPLVLADETHLESALLNIVANARDASPNGGAVTIATSRLHLNGDAAARGLPPGDYVALEIVDEGAGMPPAVLARAAEPFFTTKPQGRGTGLGLATVHGFLQQSRGRLEIDSEPGRGTTVRMILPAHAPGVAEPDAAPAAGPPRAQAPAPAGPTGRTILVVEDSEDVLALARELLEEQGHAVLAATDAEAALAILDRAEARIDLLFTDLVMPGSMNGLALADAARARRPGLPVLYTTGYNEQLVGGADAAPPAGADVLGKPYRRAELLDRVAAALAAPAPGPRRTGSDFGAAEE